MNFIERQICRKICWNKRNVKVNVKEVSAQIEDIVVISLNNTDDENNLLEFLKTMDMSNKTLIDSFVKMLIDYIAKKYIKTNNAYGWIFFEKIYFANEEFASILSDKADKEWNDKLMSLWYINEASKKNQEKCKESLEEIEKDIKKTKEHYEWLLKRKAVVEKELEGIKVY